MEISTKFTSVEGVYNLREVITLDGATEYHPIFGTKITMASLKSSTEPQDALEKLGSSSKFVEIPPQENEKFSFLKQKKAKPTVSVTKTNSAFVSKIVANENLAKIISIKSGETFYLFFNVGRAVVWTDYMWKLQAPLSVIHFKDAVVTCHDVNLFTRESMNSVVGFTTGDVSFFNLVTLFLANFRKVY